MLPSKSRLTKDEVAEVFEKGARASNKNGSVIFLKQRTGLKIAVVVSKKIAGSAVVRNTIRRRTYSAAGRIRAFIYPSHIAILLGKASVGMKGEELVSALKELLRKANLLLP